MEIKIGMSEKTFLNNLTKLWTFSGRVEKDPRNDAVIVTLPDVRSINCPPSSWAIDATKDREANMIYFFMPDGSETKDGVTHLSSVGFERGQVQIVDMSGFDLTRLR